MNVSKILQSGILEQYVLGLTSPSENSQVEKYMVEHPEIKDKVQRLRSCMDHYTGVYNIPCPTEIRSDKQNNSPKRDNCLFVESKFGKTQVLVEDGITGGDSSFSFVSFASLMILILAGSSIYFYTEHSNNSHQLYQLQNRITHLESEYNNASTQINLLEKNNQLLKDAQTRRMLMSGTPIAPEAKAVLYYNDAQKQMLLDPSSLPHTSPNQCYHIWAELQNRKKVCMGQITPVVKNQANLVPLEFIKGVSQFIITKEDDGKEHPLLRGSFH